MEVNGERTNYIKKMDSRFFQSNLDLPFGGYGFQFWIFNFDIDGN
jgi:hypothetical protein